MKKRFMVLIGIGIIGLLLVFTSRNDALADQKYIPFITTDLRPQWEYDIMGTHWEFQDVDTSFTGDPFRKAADKASEKMTDYAKKIGADAVIGFRMEMSNFSNSYVGKLLMYGTFIKLKTSAPSETKPPSATPKPK